MKRDDFHKKPFDGGTILKLEILTKYLDEWFPVFLHQAQIRRINIFDFQCGPGHDVNGIEGSPFRIVRALEKATLASPDYRGSVDIFFNDVSKEKVDQLASSLSDNVAHRMGKIHFSVSAFEDCFTNCAPIMKQYGTANFLFIDPTGLVRVEWMIEQLSMLKFTDFLIFIPSSDLYRFNKKDEFQSFFPGLEFEGSLIDASKEICNYLRTKLLTSDQKYYLAQFAIRKNRAARINSLIFGSRSLLGLNKFLTVAWDKSPNGEANYDMCGDMLCSKQRVLPFMDKNPRKIEWLLGAVRGLVLDRTLRTNRDAVEFCLINGFLPAHGKDALRVLKQVGILKKVPPMSYGSVFKANKVEPIVT